MYKNTEKKINKNKLFYSFNKLAIKNVLKKYKIKNKIILYMYH